MSTEEISQINQQIKELEAKKQALLAAENAQRQAEIDRIAEENRKRIAEERIRQQSLPHFEVDFSTAENSFIIKVGPYGNSYYITSNFIRAVTKHGNWYIQEYEGYKIPDAFLNKTVVYSTVAQEKINQLIETRTRIDEIALQTDTDKIPEDIFPTHAIKLKPLQKVFVEFAEAVNGRVICADLTGMGKTAEALAYAEYIQAKSVIIICPALIKVNWEREIKRLTGKLPETFYGTSPEPHHITKMIVERPRFSLFNYDLLSRVQKIPNEKKKSGFDERYLWIDLINGYGPDLVIIDECHYIKNLNAGRTKAILGLKAKKVILLSGTPMLNRPGELYPLLNLIDPSNFNNYEAFLSEYTYNGKEPKNVEQLRALLKTIMIRRKRDYTDAVVNRIPKYHELSDDAARVYAKIMQGIAEIIDEAGDKMETAIPNILVQIMRMKQICAMDKIDEIADFATELWDNNVEDRYRKVIIFTQFVDIAKAIAAKLGHEAMLITGEDSINDRDSLVQEFQTSNRYHFLVATVKSIKEGHTITEAGKTIFADLFWTPADHEQAEGRSFARVNDPHGIDSYYFVTVNSIEEWIMDLLFAKLNVITQVVEGAEADRQASIAGDLIQKLLGSNMFLGLRRKK